MSNILLRKEVPVIPSNLNLIYDKILRAPTYDDHKKPNYGYQASPYDK
jgi:hypothetical protein